MATIPALAQQASGSGNQEFGPYLLSAASPQGNYIYLFRGMNTPDSISYYSANRFIIERAENDLSDSTAKLRNRKIGELAPISSSRELHGYYSDGEIKELLQLYNLTSEDELIVKIRTQRLPRNYDIAYFDIRMQQAIGHVYLDATAEFGKTYLYLIYTVDGNGDKKRWGYAVQSTRKQNAGLRQYRPSLDSSHISDSLVVFNWSYGLEKKTLPQADNLKSFANNDENLLITENLRLRTFVFRNGKPIDSRLYFGLANKKEDRVVVGHSALTQPEDIITAFTVIEDEVGNQGVPSDTAYAVSLSFNKAPIILAAHIQEVTDGLRISWPALPAKRYIAGVQIERLAPDVSIPKFITLAGPGDTLYTDYTAVAGTAYRYLVRTVFGRGIPFRQEVPAIITGTLARFSKPVPPTRLRIANVGQNVRIDWDSSVSKGIFGYYVFRGHDGSPMELISGPVKETGYLDTARHLSGRSVYAYAVQTQNLMQDTSILSEVVSIKPVRAIDVNGPATISKYYVNGVLQLSWDDARKSDSYIVGYQLEKSAGENGTFAPFGPLLAKPFALDSGFAAGTAYQYRVAAIGPKGEKSEYSNAALFEMPKVTNQTAVSPVTRNTGEGIEVSWNGIQLAGQKDFAVYRRILPSSSYEVIGTSAPGKHSFVDASAREGESYIYAVTFRYNDGSEGPKGLPKAHIYHKQPAPQR